MRGNKLVGKELFTALVGRPARKGNGTVDYRGEAS